MGNSRLAAQRSSGRQLAGAAAPVVRRRKHPLPMHRGAAERHLSKPATMPRLDLRTRRPHPDWHIPASTPSQHAVRQMLSRGSIRRTNTWRGAIICLCAFTEYVAGELHDVQCRSWLDRMSGTHLFARSSEI